MTVSVAPIAAKGIVFPDRIKTGDDAWRLPSPVEFYVDFETVSSINDHFTDVTKQGGKALIFQIGCLWRDPKSRKWNFRQWTTNRLTGQEEIRIINEWVAAMDAVARVAGTTLAKCRVIHWSPAEVSFLEKAYNSARARNTANGKAKWPELPWFDFLTLVIRKAPVNVRGAFNFGLKSVAKSMHKAGLIKTSWADGGATDGLGAMTGAWACDKAARANNCSMNDIDLMSEIAHYNEVDVRVMAEIVDWLRNHR